MKLYAATENALAVLTLDQDECRCDLLLENRRPQCVAADPLRPELLVCGTFGDGAWRSDDAGQTWRPVGDGIRHQKILSVAISRTGRVNGRGVVFVGTEPSMIYRSANGGESWRECSGLTELPSASQWSFPPRPDTHHVRWIHLDPHSVGRMFAAIEAGALISSPDFGETWEDRVPRSPIDTHQLASHLSAPGRLYSAAGDGYFESNDGGESWEKPEEGLLHKYVWSVAVDSGYADTILVSSAASAHRSHGKESTESFIHRRTASSAWVQVRDGLPEPAGRRTSVLAAHPNEPKTFFAIWEGDLFRSMDGGSSWQRLRVPWPDEGFSVGEPRALAVADAA